MSTVSSPRSPDQISTFAQRCTPDTHNPPANRTVAACDAEPLSQPDSNAQLLEGQDRVFGISAAQMVLSPHLRDRKQSRLSFSSRTLSHAQQTSPMRGEHRTKSDVGHNLWNLRVIQSTLKETSSDESGDHSDNPKETLCGSL